MKTFLSIVAAFLVIVAILWITEKRTAAMLDAYTKYEACVQSEYGMLPSTYYQLHGVTPSCS